MKITFDLENEKDTLRVMSIIKDRWTVLKSSTRSTSWEFESPSTFNITEIPNRAKILRGGATS